MVMVSVWSLPDIMETMLVNNRAFILGALGRLCLHTGTTQVDAFLKSCKRRNAILGGGRRGYSIRHWVKELCEIRKAVPSLLASVFLSEGNFEF